MIVLPPGLACELSLVSAEAPLIRVRTFVLPQSQQGGSRNYSVLLAVLLLAEQVPQQSFGRAGASKGCVWFHPDFQLILAK